MLQLICEANKCIACGACQNICQNSCITFETDEYEVKRAYIDTENCVECNLCKKVCPVIERVSGCIPNACYAAWSLDENVRRESASGGIATELYRYGIDSGYWIAGVKMNEDYEAVYSLTKDNCFTFQNSKYVFSNMGKIYIDISDKLKAKEKILFVGLPCQIASLRSFLKIKKIEETNLILVDLICHGSTPEKYLKQHIKGIRHKKNTKSIEVDFRNPKYETDKYYFTLANNGKVFYKKNVNQDDEYQIAYHKSIAFRENCYTCQWANKERMGDITLSDFPGLGSKGKYNYSHKNVSCVMINTQKGENLYNKLLNKKIYSVKRPLEENFAFQPTLSNPIPKPLERKKFLISYRETRDFDRSIQKAACKIILSNRWNSITRYRDIKRFLLRLIPENVKNQIKKIFNRQ